MKKQIEKRLQLSKDTLRNLSEAELLGVAGGVTTTCCGTTSGCTYPGDTCSPCSNPRLTC